MAPFKKQKPVENQPGRRRPLTTDPASKRTQAFSYYAQRSVPQANTGRGQALETTDMNSAAARPWYLSRAAITTAAVIVVIGALYLTALSGNPKLVTLTTNGSGYFLQDSAVYQEAAAKSLSRSIFNKNKLTIDSGSVSHDLIHQYPELASATVTTPLVGHQPTVYITPYEPSFMLSTIDNKVFLLDTNGRALASNSQITSDHNVQVPTLEDKSGLAISLGTQALPADTVHFATEVLSLLAAAKVGYTQLVLPASSSELDVYISGQPYFVKFNLQGDAKLEVGTFLATQERLTTDKTTPTQYIDVRVSERAYYR